MRNDTALDVMSAQCGVLLANGKDCGSKPQEGMPFPICARHAIQVSLAVRDIAATRLLQGSVPIGTMRRQRESERDAGSLVYYVELPGDRIKIGTTKNLTQRVRALRVGIGAVLATEPGGVGHERRRHRQFAAYRIGELEDFRDVPALREWIAELRDQQRRAGVALTPK
jgi:hypothetical protein